MLVSLRSSLGHKHRYIYIYDGDALDSVIDVKAFPRLLMYVENAFSVFAWDPPAKEIKELPKISKVLWKLQAKPGVTKTCVSPSYDD